MLFYFFVVVVNISILIVLREKSYKVTVPTIFAADAVLFISNSIGPIIGS